MNAPCNSSLIGNIWDDLVNYATLIATASTPTDRIALILYILSFPLRLAQKILGRECSRKLLRGATLRNSDGLFYCGKSFVSCRIVGTRYEEELRDYFHLTSGVFVDIGSHVGKYAIRVARTLGENGRVVAIEPDPVNFSMLEANVQLNHLSNIHLENVACSDHDGWMNLYLNAEHPTQHSLFFDTGQGSVVVRSLSLDTILTSLKIARVDLIKIDAEAAEIDILNGAKKALAESCPTIVFEAWNEEHLSRAETLLLPFSYELRRISGANYVAFQKRR